MSKPIVYLAGPISGLSYGQAVGWRFDLARTLGPYFEVLSPMRGKEGLASVQAFSGEYPDHLLSQAAAIVARDLTDVDRADLLIVKEPAGSLGTAIEIGYALHSQKPLIVILAEDDTARRHPFLTRLPKLVIVSNLTEAALLARSIFNV